MGHPIAEYARHAYAAGWASTGAPMTPRVAAGCTAAMTLATHHADDPHVLELTVDLGRLEGMWARLFGRRQDLINRHTATLATHWQRLVAALAITQAIRRLRAANRTTDADLQAAAAAEAATLVAALPEADGWADLQTALADALTDAHAEGIVAAVAIGTPTADSARLDWDTAFTATLATARRLNGQDTDTSHWSAVLLRRATRDLTRALRTAAAGSDDEDNGEDDEDTRDDEDQADTAHHALAGALPFTADWAMTTAATAAAHALYRTYGAQKISVITVGDGKVCPACADAEHRSPWAADSVPALPLHAQCRCVYEASVDPGDFPSWFT